MNKANNDDIQVRLNFEYFAVGSSDEADSISSATVHNVVMSPDSSLVAGMHVLWVCELSSEHIKHKRPA